MLGADESQVGSIYEETVLSILRPPRLVKTLACGRERALMLLADGRVYQFPNRALPREVEFPPRAEGRVVKLAAGNAHFVALTDHLVWNVYSWGYSTQVVNAASEELLGRRLRSAKDARVPGVVPDISARVSNGPRPSFFSLFHARLGTTESTSAVSTQKET